MEKRLSMEVRRFHSLARKEAMRMVRLGLNDKRLNKMSFLSFQKLQIMKIYFVRLCFMGLMEVRKVKKGGLGGGDDNCNHCWSNRLLHISLNFGQFVNQWSIVSIWKLQRPHWLIGTIFVLAWVLLEGRLSWHNCHRKICNLGGMSRFQSAIETPSFL